MNELLLKTYIIISVLIALADILLSIISIQKNKTTGRYLGFACAVAAVVDISLSLIHISEPTRPY